jgi:hypothetical protein
MLSTKGVLILSLVVLVVLAGVAFYWWELAGLATRLD